MKDYYSDKKIAYISKAGLIAALYAAITLIFAPISFGAVQFRISEVMTVLPFFFPEAIPGLFIGCIISNLLSSNIVVLDVIFGSLATLLAAICTYKIKVKWLAPLPPIIFNAIIIGVVITVSSVGENGFAAAFIANMLSVGAGELVVAYGLGIPLMIAVERIGNFRKKAIE
ncbi:MAG: QueT transporter family protein [Clostridiales bacterium]|nr:QueT transporter family protein [Clostridiales bacterium]